MLILALLLAGCTTLDSRQALHRETLEQFYYVDQSGGPDPFLASAAGPVIGDCDDFALAMWTRSGGACKPWAVTSGGVQHVVCRWPDGFYADNLTRRGSWDASRYTWIIEIPTDNIPVVVR